MKDSALDLGAKGKDNEYGYGLVQVDETYKCLKDDLQCCSATEANPAQGASTDQNQTTVTDQQPECSILLDQARQCLDSNHQEECRMCINGELLS